jgi:hypothetical protein
MVSVDLINTVAIPPEAIFDVAPRRVPCPVIVNNTVFVAVLTSAFPGSETLAVMSEVATLSAFMAAGLAVHRSFVATWVTMTLTVPCIMPDEVAVTVAVP